MRAVNHFLSYELRADYLVIRLKFLVDFLPQLILQKMSVVDTMYLVLQRQECFFRLCHAI